MILLLAGPTAFAADQCGDADLSKLTSWIYVAPTGSDSSTCGASAAAPCQSIQQGINRCSGAGCGVLVHYGRYDLTATIQLKDGVSVYGRCVFAGDVDRKYRSTLLAPAGGQPAFNAANLNTPTWLDGFFVRGSDATTPGGASIAMTISNSAGLTLRWNELVSGKGADGAPGATPSQAGQGQRGGNAQTAPFNDGGGGSGGPACNGNTSSGQGGGGASWRKNSLSGCFAWCVCNASNGSSGAPGGQSGNVSGGAPGGPGGDAYGCTGLSGDAGQGGGGLPGSPGKCSAQGGKLNDNTQGSFNGVNWAPVPGGAGDPGNVGSGGGGGGAGGLCAKIATDGLTWFPYWGQPGGGGGGGGCGGSGGPGGGQGGASIPLVLLQSPVTFDHVSIVPGPGGRGGNGGQGGVGGPGGGAGNGGASSVCSLYNSRELIGWGGTGGPGGLGGQGGAGAGGAGGNGGPSIGIALVGKSPPLPNEQGIYAGQPGTGGSKGLGGQNDSTQCKGADGADGVAGGKASWWQYLPEGYASCAQEGGTCSFSGTKEVAYGANGRFFYKTATNSINCNNGVFGDPIYGTVKACYILK